MKSTFFVWPFCLLLLMLLSTNLEAQPHYFPVPPPTVDHSKFKDLKGPFKQPEEVTRACLKCHNKAGEQAQKSLHWTWNWPGPNGRKLGKAHVINNF